MCKACERKAGRGRINRNTMQEADDRYRRRPKTVEMTATTIRRELRKAEMELARMQRTAGLANLYPQYHNCWDLVDCLMQTVYYDGLEGEGPEIVHDDERAAWYIPKDDPDPEATIHYLQDNFDALYDQAFEAAHDEVRAEVQRLADQWTAKVQAAAIVVADKKGLDPDVVVDLVMADLVSLSLDEGGAGSGTWDKDKGEWADLKDMGVTGKDILDAMQRGYGPTLDDQLIDATSIVMSQAGKLAAEAPYED